MKDIPLKLKSFGCYMANSKGCHFYTEHGFKIFVPKAILKKIKTKVFKSQGWTY